MDISFENHGYNKLLEKTGLNRSGNQGQFIKVLIPFLICWLPLAVLSLIYQTFWTGNFAGSFITSFDTQAKFLIAMPIFILAEKVVSERVGLILAQFINSGIILKEEQEKFYKIIRSNTQFLSSNWTDFVIVVICYAQVFSLQYYELDSHAALISWQILSNGEEVVMNPAGWWNVVVSRPFIMFLLFGWLLRIIVYGRLLYKISSLKLNLFAAHPDQVGGLGFLGYTMRYFSPVALGISAIVAGNMADLILVEGFHLSDFKFEAAIYLVFITLLFTFPLFSFTGILIKTRERSIFENYDIANGLYRELRNKWSKGYNDVKPEDLDSPDFSTVADMSAFMTAMLEMKTFPFTLKDLIPFWIMAVIPFLPVIATEIPLVEVFKKLLQMLG